jgi:hypothetical protein
MTIRVEAGPTAEQKPTVAWWTLSDDDLAEAIRDHIPRISAVLDTNVMLEIYACHDLLEAHDAATARFKASPDLHTPLGDLDVAFDPKVQARLKRARESLFLAMHLHRTRATTFSLRGELESKLEQVVPVDPVGSDARRQLFTGTFVHFAHEGLFPGWNPVFEGVAGPQAGSDADRALLRFAKAGNLTLITNEGRLADGGVDWSPRKIPAQAKAMGVRACTPGEFHGDVDIQAERDAFATRFQAAATAYVTSLPEEHKRLIWRDLLRRQWNHYAMLLFGPGSPDLADGLEAVPTAIA